MYEIATLALMAITVALAIVELIVKTKKGKGRHRK